MSARRQRDAQSRAAKVWQKRAFTVFLALVVVFLVRAAFDVYAKERESAQNLAHAELALGETTRRADKLKNDIERLETEEGQEEAMRQQFQMGRPGEGMILIVDNETPTTTPVVIKSGWEKFWGLIRGE